MLLTLCENTLLYSILVPSAENVSAEKSIPSRTTALELVTVLTRYLPVVIVPEPVAAVILITSSTTRPCEVLVSVSVAVVYAPPVTAVEWYAACAELIVVLVSIIVSGRVGFAKL